MEGYRFGALTGLGEDKDTSKSQFILLLELMKLSPFFIDVNLVLRQMVGNTRQYCSQSSRIDIVE